MNHREERHRLGLVIPSTNLTIERFLQRVSFSRLFDVDIVVTRLEVATIASTAESKSQFDPSRLRAVARLLADARPDVIAWTGTSSFWLGLDEERAWMQAAGNELGIPVTSASEAVMEALRERGDGTQISLLTPYETAIHDTVVKTLERAHFEVVHDENLGISDNAAFARIPQEEIEGQVRGFPGEGPVVVVCTGVCACFPALDVIDSLVAVLWFALTIASTGVRHAGARPDYRSFYDVLSSQISA